MRGAMLLAWCLTVAGAADRAPDEVLKQATDRALASAARIPNYTCVETVTRDYYWPTAATLPRACPVLLEQRRHPTPDMVLRHMMTDRLRLDVTLADRGEIFSWAGASRFNDATIDNVVREGPIGTGAFGGLLEVVFKQDVKSFQFVGRKEVGGRSLMEYSFQVAKESSSYTVKIPGGWAKSAYSGTVEVDPETGDVAHLALQSGELPPASKTCEIDLTLDLSMVRMGDSEFLLPALAHQHFVMENGEETQNAIRFAGCREYRGESTVSFFQGPETDGGGRVSRAAASTLWLTPSQPFTVELITPISFDTAAAGDVFSGTLLTPLHDKKGKTLARRGSLVEGRLLRVNCVHRAPVETLIVMQMESVESGGVKIPLAAVPDLSRELARAKKGKPRLEIILPLPSEKYAGVFRFPGDQAALSAGFRSEWRTMDADLVRYR